MQTHQRCACNTFTPLLGNVWNVPVIQRAAVLCALCRNSWCHFAVPWLASVRHQRQHTGYVQCAPLCWWHATNGIAQHQEFPVYSASPKSSGRLPLFRVKLHASGGMLIVLASSKCLDTDPRPSSTKNCRDRCPPLPSESTGHSWCTAGATYSFDIGRNRDDPCTSPTSAALNTGDVKQFHL